MKLKGDEDRTASSSGASHEVTPPTTGVRASPSEYSKPMSSSKEIKEDKLKQARVEMGEVREENKRLKSLLSQIAKDYQCLQMQFRDALQQEGKTNVVVPKTTSDSSVQSQGENDTHEIDSELVVSLTLGRTLSGGTSDQIDDERKLDLNEAKSNNDMPAEELKLGLDCGYAERVCPGESVKQASRESLEVLKEDEIAEIWPPSKILKTVKASDDECSQPMSQVKKARVSIRARCDTPTMNDGCQWRKYGQKIAKGNPCPRAYYRCTISSSCPVRKQVQRCVDDMSILITTYEGNHNHPLPASATAMASTTSAAVSMLNSRSSTSQKDPDSSATGTPYNPNSTTSASLHGLSFSLSQDSRSNRLTYFPNSSISTCNSHPTITLDLTSPINSSNCDRFSTNTSSSHVPKYYPTSSLNFASSSTTFGSSQLFLPWESSNFLSYKATPENRSIHFQGGSFDLGRQENSYKRSYLQMSGPAGSSQESLMSETIAAATKAIATNPSFHSALAAALSSCVGNGNRVRELNYAPRSGDSSLENNLIQISGKTKVPCVSSFQGKPVNMDFQQQGGMINLFPPSLSLSTSAGGSSGSPAENYKDQIKFLANSSV